MDEVKLEPCPWCGPAARIEIMRHVGNSAYWHANCLCCDCEGPPAATIEEAAEYWNRRQPQSVEWVPWKEGDPLPMQAMYTVTMDDGFLGITDAANFEANFVIAYLHQPLPDPYTDAQGKRDE